MKEKPPHPKKIVLIEKKYKGEDIQNPHLPELKQFLQENWEQIDEVYYSLQKRAGVEKPVHIPHRIKTDPTLEYGTGAAVSPRNRGTVLLKNRSFLSDPDHDFPQLVHFWIHEAVHSTSHTKEKIRLFPKIAYTLSSGVSSQNITLNPSPEDKRILKYLGEDLNEAITEHIANTILSELSRRGIFKQNDEVIREKAAYKSQGESFAEVVSTLARSFEVSEELIWQAFVRQYFTGEMSLESFYATLLHLGKEKDIKPVKEKLVALIDEAKASKVIKVGKEIEIPKDVVKERETEALDWSKRGLRLGR